jgi:hypothetical protein
VALALTSFALLLPVVPQPIASASDNGEWSLEPAGLDGAPSGRRFFDHEIAPGEALQDRATLSNFTDHSLTFNLYAADAYVTDDGGFAVRLRDDPREGVGAWVSLTTDSIAVPAKSSVSFPLQIGVPRDATPGDWAGGIVASLAAPASPEEGPPGLVIEKGVAARIYVRVSGPRHPAVDVRHINLDAGTMSLAPVTGAAHGTVSYDVVNTGNTRLSGSAHVEIEDVFGRTVHRFPDRPFSDLLPEAHVTMSESWEGIPLTGIRYHARVVLTADEIRIVSSSAGAWHLPVVLILGAGAAVVVLIGARRRVGRLWVRHRAPVTQAEAR